MLMFREDVMGFSIIFDLLTLEIGNALPRHELLLG